MHEKLEPIQDQIEGWIEKLSQGADIVLTQQQFASVQRHPQYSAEYESHIVIKPSTYAADKPGDRPSSNPDFSDRKTE